MDETLRTLAGQRVVVTGATNGLGMATARALAQADVRVVLAVRDIELGARRAREFGGDCEVAHLDLADLSLDTVQMFYKDAVAAGFKL